MKGRVVSLPVSCQVKAAGCVEHFKASLSLGLNLRQSPGDHSHVASMTDANRGGYTHAPASC